MSVNEPGIAAHALRKARFADYLAIARFDHATKHIFIVPGVLLAYLLRGVGPDWHIGLVALGMATAVSIASANYVINEWLDRDFDRHHPTKSARTAVNVGLDGRLVLVEWLAFIALGLACAGAASLSMLCIAAVFALQGVVYNVPPIRLKDKTYLDVVAESINNPLRLMIGWTMIDPQTLPPSSVILTFWFGGAFLMSAKRLSEYREIAGLHGAALLNRYRASFANYSEVSLTTSCFVYALLSVFCLGVFLIKYRIEYILTVPIIIALFAQYLSMSMKPDSTAQKPEKLFRERSLMAIVALLVLLFVATTFIDIPFLNDLTNQKYIGFG